MPQTIKLVDLEIEETSGVDHPAHLYEGWLVRKDATAVLDEALAEARDDTHDTDQGSETVDLTPTIDTPAEDVVVEEPAPATARSRSTSTLTWAEAAFKSSSVQYPMLIKCAPIASCTKGTSSNTSVSRSCSTT